MIQLKGSEVQRLRSHLRLVAILYACRNAGITPVPVSAVHTIAYFTDALAPIWDIPLVEGQVLKKKRVPISPELQAAIDELVGRAVFLAGNVRHVPVDGSWSLDADYSLNAVLGRRIVDAMDRDLEYRRELAFVQEVVLALAGLGVPGLSVAAQADATYSDPNIDFGGIVDLDNSEEITRTSQVTKKFAELVGQNHRLTEAELTHLYVRHLYSLLRGRSD